MTSSVVSISREGLKKLEEELQSLSGRKRILSEEMSSMVSQDTEYSFNPSYIDAKDQLYGYIPKREAEIKRIMSNSCVLEDSEEYINFNGEKVIIGAKVKLFFTEDKEEGEFTIVSSEEADPSNSKASITSPLGEKVIGKRKGETFELRGQLVEVLDIKK